MKNANVTRGTNPVHFRWRIRKELPDGMFTCCEYNANVIPITATQVLESPAVKKWLGTDKLDEIYHPNPSGYTTDDTP